MMNDATVRTGGIDYETLEMRLCLARTPGDCIQLHRGFLQSNPLGQSLRSHELARLYIATYNAGLTGVYELGGSSDKGSEVIFGGARRT